VGRRSRLDCWTWNRCCGEYEWFQTIKADDVPRVVTLLGGDLQEDVFDLLQARYTGDRPYEIAKRLRGSDIRVAFHAC
jgi:hypothetical protein